MARIAVLALALLAGGGGCGGEEAPTVTATVTLVEATVTRGDVDHVEASFVVTLDRAADGGEPTSAVLTFAELTLCDAGGFVTTGDRSNLTYETDDVVPARVESGGHVEVHYRLRGDLAPAPRSGWSVWCALPVDPEAPQAPGVPGSRRFACEGAGEGRAGLTLDAVVEHTAWLEVYGPNAQSPIATAPLGVPLEETDTEPPPVETPIAFTIELPLDAVESLAIDGTGAIVATTFAPTGDAVAAHSLVGIEPPGSVAFSHDLPLSPVRVAASGALTIVAGTIEGDTTVLGSPLSATNLDAFAAALDTAGNVLWVTTVGGRGQQTLSALAVAEDVAVAGYNETPIVLAGTSLPVGGYVVTLDAAGVPIEAVALPTAPLFLLAVDSGLIAFGSDGSVHHVAGGVSAAWPSISLAQVTAAASDGTGALVLGSGFDGLPDVVRYDASGAVLWQHDLGAPALASPVATPMVATSVAASGDRVLVTGYLAVDADLGTGVLDAGGTTVDATSTSFPAGATAFLVELDLATGSATSSEIVGCSHSLFDGFAPPVDPWLLAADPSSPGRFALGGTFKRLAIGEGLEAGEPAAFVALVGE
jgi:hypothetical protein